MNKTTLMARILKENYTLSELEDRLEVTAGDLYEGFEDYVDNNFDEVTQCLQEDLFDIN